MTSPEPEPDPATEPTPAQAVAAEVRAHLARQQMSASAAARALGWGQVYLSRRVRGVVPMDVNDLSALAQLLNVPISVFFEGVSENPRLMSATTNRSIRNGRNKPVYSVDPLTCASPETELYRKSHNKNRNFRSRPFQSCVA